MLTLSNLQDTLSYNIILGSYYLAGLLEEYEGSYPFALAAYNAGPKRVKYWKKINGNPQKVLMERGDLVFYHGCDLTHWRESFDGKYAIQLFLHYVNTNNSEADNIKKIRSERKNQDVYIKNNNRMRITKSGWPWPRIRNSNDKK